MTDHVEPGVRSSTGSDPLPWRPERAKLLSLEDIEMIPELKPLGTNTIRAVNIEVASVAYLKNDETPQTGWAAVLIKLTLSVEKFIRTDVTLNMRLLPSDGQNGQVLQLPFLYPDQEEVVAIPTERYTNVTSVVQNSLDVGPEDTLTRKRISRVGMRCTTSNPQIVQVCWSFRNDHTSYYPASHSLILLLRCDPKTDHTSFSFEISLYDLQVTYPGWKRFMNVLKSQRPRYEVQIMGNHEPDVVYGLLQQIRDGTTNNLNITLRELVNAAGMHLI